jgi:hypothetical protein
MPIDPQTGFAFADPSQWWPTRALPRIVVHPNPPNGPSSDGIDDWFVPGAATADMDHPDDWFVPTGARADTSYPDDWYVPEPAPTPNTAQPALGAQPNAANPGISNPPAARPDPFAAYWSLIPASRAGAMAWHPPIFLNSLGQFPPQAPAPLNVPQLDTGHGLLGALANLQGTNTGPTGGLLGAIANLPSAKPAAFPLFQLAGPGSDDGDQSAPASFLQSLANLSWSPPAGASAATSDTGDKAGRFPPLDGAPFDAQRINAPLGFTPPPQNSQPATPASFLFLKGAGPTSGDSDRSAPQSPIQDLSDLHQPPQLNGSVDAGSTPSAAPSTRSNEPPSTTRVVRDSAGRALALIHVQPAPSNAPLPKSDATPDPLHPRAQYAQINNAVTGNPVIDRTTDMLLAVLQQSVLAMGPGSGARFGTAVHVDFANRVKKLDLPGIGQDGVEQGFHFDIKDFVQYGLEGSIRTDVTLKDPNDPNQKPIAVYDLKTGNAVLRSGRVEEILRKVNSPGLLVIELQYRTGAALDRTKIAPPR